MKTKRAGYIFTINMDMSLFFVIVIGILILLAIYFWIPEHKEDTRFVATVLGGAAAIYSAYYVGAGLRLSQERDKQRASFEILALLGQAEFVRVRTFLEKEIEDHETRSAVEIYEKITKESELEKAAIHVLGVLEDIAIAIREDYADENMLYLSMSSIASRYHNALHLYVKQLRKNHDDDAYFVELENLCKAWEQGKRLSDGRRFGPIVLA